MTDPIFAAIARHRRAYAALEGRLHLRPADEQGDAEAHAYEALAAIVPTTLPGLLALTRYLGEVLLLSDGFVDAADLELGWPPNAKDLIGPNADEVLNWPETKRIILNAGKAARALAQLEARP